MVPMTSHCSPQVSNYFWPLCLVLLIVPNMKLSWFEVLEFTEAAFVPSDNIYYVIHSETNSNNIDCFFYSKTFKCPTKISGGEAWGGARVGRGLAQFFVQ